MRTQASRKGRQARRTSMNWISSNRFVRIQLQLLIHNQIIFFLLEYTRINTISYRQKSNRRHWRMIQFRRQKRRVILCYFDPDILSRARPHFTCMFKSIQGLHLASLVKCVAHHGNRIMCNGWCRTATSDDCLVHNGCRGCTGAGTVKGRIECFVMNRMCTLGCQSSQAFVPRNTMLGPKEACTRIDKYWTI